MCGIIGYAGTKNAHGVLIDGLKALEYRGYDSSGLAVFTQGRINTVKAQGKIKNLEALLKEDTGTCGIAHTRWATHGEANVVNAHPHTIGMVTLVHNGIIENADELRKTYQQKGIVFASDTDTETIAALINDFVNQGMCKIDACLRAGKYLKGSYALAILFADEPDTIYAMRKDSPLILGLSDDGNYVASDVSAFLKATNKILELEEHEVVWLTRSQVEIFNQQGKVERNWHTSCRELSGLDKNGFDSYLLKEIHEQPLALSKTIAAYMNNDFNGLEKVMPDLTAVDFIYFVACGSACHAGMFAKHWVEKLAHIRCACECASEFRYGNPFFDQNTLVVLISQSGETADTLAALRMCRKRGIKTVAIVNVEGSSIAKEADVYLPTSAGIEVSVATTKAYTCQVAVLALFCIHAAIQRHQLSIKDQKQLLADLNRLPALMADLIRNDTISQFADQIGNAYDVFFIGRGLDYAQSLEGSLKLKEISYIHSEAYAAGELKHGTISLIEAGTPVLALISDAALAAKTYSNMAEVKARGAKLLLVIREDLYQHQSGIDTYLKLPKVHPLLQGIISIIPYQLLAYHLAKRRGCNLDQPRNLAKSVTVE